MESTKKPHDGIRSCIANDTDAGTDRNIYFDKFQVIGPTGGGTTENVTAVDPLATEVVPANAMVDVLLAAPVYTVVRVAEVADVVAAATV